MAEARVPFQKQTTLEPSPHPAFSPKSFIQRHKTSLNFLK
jgi:hypothetical protein